MDGWKKKAMVVIVTLLAINVWATRSREAGPDPEVEALHSEEEAIRVCSDAIESRLAGRNPNIVDSGRADYLQGGEYVVRFVVELRSNAGRTGNLVVCQLQFTAETGWIVEDVTVDAG